MKKKHRYHNKDLILPTNSDEAQESSSQSTQTCHYHAVGQSTARLLEVSQALADGR